MAPHFGEGTVRKKWADLGKLDCGLSLHVVIVAVWLGALKGMDTYCQTSWGEGELGQQEGPGQYAVNLSLLGLWHLGPEL